jgi:serine/threonine protein kinase
LLEEPYSFSADIFSLGCVMLELYHSEEIFKGSSSIDQLFKLYEFIDNFDSWPAGCNKMNQFGIQVRPGNKRAAILSKLQSEDAFNPYQRIRAQDILRHKYFNNVCLPV